MIKKIFFGVATLGVLALNGCTREFEKTMDNWRYTNPQKIGGYWTIIQNGTEVNHLKCIYWSAAPGDDDACFKADNGKVLFVNGSSIIIQE